MAGDYQVLVFTTTALIAGGGYVGGHAAAETEPAWTFYRGLVGTGVSGVASTGAAPIEVADRAHPATEPLARQLTLTELFLVVRGADGGPATGRANLNRVEFAAASP